MRKVFAIAAMGLLVLTLPALAALPAVNTDGNDNSPAPGPRDGPSGECPGTVVWDSGMYDSYTIPSGCSSAGSAACLDNAVVDPAFGEYMGHGWDKRIMADDFFASTDSPITHIKTWHRVNCGSVNAGFTGDTAHMEMLHGFCVSFYEAVKVLGDVYCPDGSLPGESFIGPKVYSAYATTWDYWWITTGVVRNLAFCVHLPYPAFYPTEGKWYWCAVMPDFDFVYGGTAGGCTQPWTQLFSRVYPGLGISKCEVQMFDGWSEGEGASWTPLSVAFALPCWTGWDAAFKLYSGEPPVATEPTTWGKIKANYR